MKRVLFLTFVLFITVQITHAGLYLAQPSDSFTLEGYVKSGTAKVSGVMINVYLNNEKVKSLMSSISGDFRITLKQNKEYIIETIKKDYITQKITINTNVTEDVAKNGGIGSTADFEIQIFPYYQGLKVDLFANPVRYFVFNPKSGWYFEEDKRKSKTPQLGQISTKVEQQKQKLLKTYNTRIDSCKKKNDFELALVVNNQILEMFPDDQTALDNAKEMKKQIRKDKQSFDSKYKEMLSKADEQFKAKQYTNARQLYFKAKAVKPEDPFPSNRIYLIDSLVNKLYSDNKAGYDKIIAKADSENNKKNYEEAIKNYESATALLPDEQYPKRQINAIKTAIENEKKKKEQEQKALDEKYNGLITKADNLLSQSDFNNAILSYNQALALKPNEAYPKTQIIKADELKNKAEKEKQQKIIDNNYSDTLKLADKAYSNKDYPSATALYNALSRLKPGEKHPKKRLEEIKTLIQKKNDMASANTKTESPKTKENITNNENNEDDTLSSKKDLLKEALADEQKGNIEAASKTYIKIANQSQDNHNIKEALIYLDKALNLFKKKNDKAGEALVLNQMASAYYDTGQYKQTINIYNEVIKIKKDLGDSKGQATILTQMGAVLEDVYQYDQAIEAYNEVLNISQKLGLKENVITTSNKLANVYYTQNDYKNSLQFYKKSLAVVETTGNIQEKANILNSIGVVNYKMGNFENAVNYYNQAISIENQSGNKKGVSLAYNNIGNINFDWNKYEKAIEYYQKSLKIKKELNFEEGMSVSFLNIGNAYAELKDFNKAIEFINTGLSIAEKIKFREVVQQSYKTLSKIYEQNQDFKNAMKAYKAYTNVMGPGLAQEGQISELNDMYTQENKTIRDLRKELQRQKFLTDFESMQNAQKQKMIEVKNLEIRNQKAKEIRQKIIIGFSLVLLAIAGAFALQYKKRYQEKKKFSDVISFQKRQITDSIEYASRIQNAVLPPIDVVKSAFPESFIFNKPKDIVSGDYFYITIQGSKIYVAVADCTGHGVPGAFMSMLGISLTKEVISQNYELSANELLNKLREALMKALHQTGKDDEAKDGMDVAFCIIDINSNKLEYSGANNSCYVIRDNNLIELKADRMPIGIHPIMKPFTCHQIQLQPNDSIYLFSDGYRDQIGQNTLKKFKLGQFNELLLEIHGLPAAEQVNHLENRFNIWKGDIEQTDDILIMGIKV